MFSEAVPEGRVVSTDPAAGTPLKRDSAVDILVSKGPKPIKITDWTGKSAGEGEKSLDRWASRSSHDEQYSDDVTKGKVISQTPSSGTGFKDDEITLVVSKGPQLFEIPRVRGLRTNDARRKLQDAGFEVEVRRRRQLPRPRLRRCAPTPAGGSMAPKGSTIIAQSPRLSTSAALATCAHESHSVTVDDFACRHRERSGMSTSWRRASSEAGRTLHDRRRRWAGWSSPASRWTAPV